MNTLPTEMLRNMTTDELVKYIENGRTEVTPAVETLIDRLRELQDELNDANERVKELSTDVQAAAADIYSLEYQLADARETIYRLAGGRAALGLTLRDEE